MWYRDANGRYMRKDSGKKKTLDMFFVSFFS
jgi:hypothetical protein